METTGNTRDGSQRSLTIGIVIFAAGLAALVFAILAPMGFGGRAPIGNVFAAMIGLGALVFGISYVRVSVQVRRSRRQLQREGMIEGAPGERPSPAAPPQPWDAEGLPRVDGAARRQRPELPQPWRHTGV